MCEKEVINNEFYNELGLRWYQSNDHPIALLRAENSARTPWVIQTILKQYPSKKIEVLDVACGGGFLTNPLALEGFQVTGVDLSQESLEVAKINDTTKTVRYLQADAYQLPFPDQSFDVICSMDFLEHVEDPEKIVKEISRVLKPKGLFFFHTFNRNPLSWLIILKGVEWFVKNSPRNLHVYKLFVKPKELKQYCIINHLKVQKIYGLCPDIYKLAFWKMLVTRKVPRDFSFYMTSSTITSYCGYAQKE